LLGLFFIAVGMSVNLGLLFAEPARIAVIAVGLMLAKAAVLYPLAHGFGISESRAPAHLAVVLSQGGEFAFVLFAMVEREGILGAGLVDQLVLAVAVSMLLTPLAYVLNERLAPRSVGPPGPGYDDMRDEHNQVIIAGFGRVGQIVGRILGSIGRPFTALEIDSSQVDVVRRYGNKVYYGDASKLDLLRAAGAANASIFVLAIDDMAASIRTAETVLRHFPNLTIVARARNRRHQHRLMDLGVRHIFRETLLSSLAMSESVLSGLGLSADDIRHVVTTFSERDDRLIREQHAVQHDETKLIQSARDTARELESLLRRDRNG
ncbi:MAG: NAD-binding protein, partial [Woeseiaceae bacterium]